MAYIPHSVMASAGTLQGVINYVREDYLSTRTPKSKFFVDISLVGVPGGRTIYMARYLGSVSVAVTNSLGETRQLTAQGNFDDLYAEGASYGVARTVIRDKILTALMGKTVNPIKVGGRWMIR